MQSLHRAVPVTVVTAVAILAGCGSPGPTPAVATQPGAATAAPVGATPGIGPGAGIGPEDLPGELIATVFGGSAPTPSCGDLATGGDFCRWATADESVVLDVQRENGFSNEDAWREAFGNAGFDEDLPDIGVPALGGTTPLAAGYRAAAYGGSNIAYSVSLTSAGDPAAVKASVVAVIKALTGV